MMSSKQLKSTYSQYGNQSIIISAEVWQRNIRKQQHLKCIKIIELTENIVEGTQYRIK